jgi:hypothetical protein
MCSVSIGVAIENIEGGLAEIDINEINQHK